jgi:hypothetical protein
VGFYCNDVSAELTNQDVFVLSRKKANKILDVRYPISSKDLYKIFFRYENVWFQELSYVKQGMTEGRWNDDDKDMICRLVYLFPMCDMIECWEKWFLPGLNWGAISPLLGIILNESEVTAIDSYNQISPEMKYQQLDALCKIGKFGEAVCYSWEQDIEGWIQSGKPEEANLAFWGYFCEKWSLNPIKQEKQEIKEDLYRIIRFFLEQVNCLPEQLGFRTFTLPGGWDKLEEEAIDSYIFFSDKGLSYQFDVEI